MFSFAGKMIDRGFLSAASVLLWLVCARREKLWRAGSSPCGGGNFGRASSVRVKNLAQQEMSGQAGGSFALASAHATPCAFMNFTFKRSSLIEQTQFVWDKLILCHAQEHLKKHQHTWGEELNNCNFSMKFVQLYDLAGTFFPDHKCCRASQYISNTAAMRKQLCNFIVLWHTLSSSMASVITFWLRAIFIPNAPAKQEKIKIKKYAAAHQEGAKNLCSNLQLTDYSSTSCIMRCRRRSQHRGVINFYYLCWKYRWISHSGFPSHAAII